MVFKWPGSSVKCTLRPGIMCRDGEFRGECWGECFRDPGNCLAPCVTLSRGLRDLELTWRLLWARHFPCLSPSVAGCNGFIPRRWFIVIRDSESARVNWYKNHQGPGHALWDTVQWHHCTKQQNETVTNLCISNLEKSFYCFTSKPWWSWKLHTTPHSLSHKDEFISK